MPQIENSISERELTINAKKLLKKIDNERK